MKLYKCSLLIVLLAFPFLAFGADEGLSGIDPRFFGTWQGNWLEGMSSGKVTLAIKEGAGELSFTALPSFGAQSAAIGKITGDSKRLGFHTAGADGRVMRFDLKPSEDFKKLKGKAYYETLHMELELARTP
jgi:hypothetical protein